MKDEKYIEQLEKLVIFLSAIYQDNYEKAEKDFIENVNDYYSHMATIQGFKNRLAIKRIASLKVNIDSKVDLEFILSNIGGVDR